MSTKHHYFKGSISHSFVSLFTGRILMMMATGFIGLFLPIFLYGLFGESLVKVCIFYGISSLMYMVTLPRGVHFFDQKIGLQKSLRLSMIFVSIFYALLFLVQPETLWIYIPLALVALTLFRITFWIPYKTDLALFTDRKNRGRQMSIISAARMFLSVVLPLASAFIIERMGFGAVFAIAIALYLATIIPFAKLPATKEDFSWTTKESFKIFFDTLRTKRSVWGFVANGAETSVSLIIWPIFIYLLVDGDLFQVGFLSTLIVLVTVGLQLFTGKFIDTKFDKKNLLKWSSVLYAIGWIIKIFIINAFQIFIVGAYHSVTRVFTQTPFNTIAFDLSSQEGHFIDEYTVIMEMAIGFGRVLILGLTIVLLLLGIGINWVFIIAALASLAFSMLGASDVHFEKHYEAHRK